MNNLEEFKRYILLRRDAFEDKYNLRKPDGLPLRTKHYPNNLKYLDDMSQLMIRTLNNHPAPVREKLLTVLVYRLVGDAEMVRRYCDHRGVLGIQDIGRLAKWLDNPKCRMKNRYTTPIVRTGITGLTKGEYLLAVTCDFMDKVPHDNFYKWKTSEIYRSFTEWYKIYGIRDFMAYQLATDFSYINELRIQIDRIKRIPDLMRTGYTYITGEKYTARKYEQFEQDMMEWYLAQDFVDTKEKLIAPHDVGHMILGYRHFKELNWSVLRYRKPTATKRRIDGIVIARSLYEYWKERLGSQED